MQTKCKLNKGKKPKKQCWEKCAGQVLDCGLIGWSDIIQLS